MTKKTKTKKMIRPNPNGDLPQVDPTAYIDPTAQIIGNVQIGPEVFVGPNAVIRADEVDAKGAVGLIKIAAQCNVQDGVIIHALGGTEVTVGFQTSLSHGCVIHGPCTIGVGCFIGFKSVIYNAVLADGVFVNAAAVVQTVELFANSLIPAGAAIVSAEDVKQLVSTTSPANCEFMEKVVCANLKLTRGYLALDDK